MKPTTPYYLIDEQKLRKNLEKVQWLRESSGVKAVLALKCFSTWPVFKFIAPYMDGTTSSSVYEARLGYEEFGKEVHAYSVAFAADEMAEVGQYANKIIFNSLSQLDALHAKVAHLDIGLRINPQVSYSDFVLADPARPYSRLGANNYPQILAAAKHLNGVMFHYNCENDNFDNFCILLDNIAEQYQTLLAKLSWVSLGGGIDFTAENYPLEKFSQKLKAFSERFGIQVYLEPGEAVITESTDLVTSVLDIVHNEVNIAVVDSSIEAHMLDLLTYQEPAAIQGDAQGNHHYVIAGNSCLAGDTFGEAKFTHSLQIGDKVHIEDAGGYSMVKMNWFNGVKMPAIIIKKLDGSLEIAKTFTYQDFKCNFG